MALTPLPDLPDLAVESIQRHLCAAFAPHEDALDPTRYVLPLVNKQWRFCLERTPRAREQLHISTRDMESAGGAEPSQVRAWCASHASGLQALTINFKWQQVMQTASDVEEVLLELLRSVHGTLSTLQVRVDGAAAAVANAWCCLESETLMGLDNGIFYKLETLDVCLNGLGHGSSSEAQAAARMTRVVSTFGRLSTLRKLRLSMRNVHICAIPKFLAAMPCLEDLAICFDSQRRLQLPTKSADALPLPPTLQRVEIINPPMQKQDIVAQLSHPRFGRLHAVRLVWEEDPSRRAPSPPPAGPAAPRDKVLLLCST